MRECQGPPACGDATRVDDRVAGLEDFDPGYLLFDAMTVARYGKTRHRCSIVLDQGGRHTRCGFAGGDDESAPGTRFRQPGRQAFDGIDGRDSGVEKTG